VMMAVCNSHNFFDRGLYLGRGVIHCAKAPRLCEANLTRRISEAKNTRLSYNTTECYEL
jgi:hypothetical protein